MALRETGEILPLVDERDDQDGRPRRIWELPATDLAVQTQDQSVNQTFELVLHASGQETQVRITRRGLARLTPSAIDELALDDQQEPSANDNPASGSGEPSPWASAAIKAETMVAAHAGFIDEITAEAPPADSSGWATRRPIILRDLDQSLQRWQKMHDGDKPRHALIVKLAEQFGQTIAHLCERPRQVLARSRELQPVSRVQQVDSACLRWLARQPGHSVIEKAGPRQEVRAVVRRESADTLENRVVRDFMVRAIRAGKVYLLEFRGVQHERVDRVRKFLRLLDKLLRTTAIGGVRPLNRIPEPNYVLQFDRRYQQIWDAYLMLIREQRILDDIWRWRYRVWAETCLALVLASLRGQDEPASQPFRADLMLRREQVAGQFVDRDCIPSPCRLPDGRMVEILHECRQRDQFPDESVGLRACQGADMTLLVRDAETGSPRRVIGIWSLLDFGLEPPTDRRWDGASSENEEFMALLLTPTSRPPTLPHAWAHVEISPTKPQECVAAVRAAIGALAKD